MRANAICTAIEEGCAWQSGLARDYLGLTFLRSFVMQLFYNKSTEMSVVFLQTFP